MLKEFSWNTFTKTGSLDAYVLYKEIEEKNQALDAKKITEEEVAISG